MTALLTRMDGTRMPAEFSLVVGNVLPFKVSGQAPDHKHYEVRSSVPGSVKVEVASADEKQAEQRLRLVAESVTVGDKIASVRAFTKAGVEDPAVGRIDVSVQAVLLLPTATTEAGLLTRMLVVENITPGQNEFVSQAEARVAMQWMRRVLVNRLALGPQYFGVSKKKPMLSDLVTALGQVAGFQHYPTLSARLSVILNAVLKHANDGTHQQFSDYRQYLSSAIEVGSGVSVGADPCPTGLYAWRTAGTASPGDNFVLYQSRGGQDFYTLTKEFLADPLLRERKKK